MDALLFELSRRARAQSISSSLVGTCSTDEPRAQGVLHGPVQHVSENEHGSQDFGSTVLGRKTLVPSRRRYDHGPMTHTDSAHPAGADTFITVVGVDGSASALNAVRWAAAAAGETTLMLVYAGVNGTRTLSDAFNLRSGGRSARAHARSTLASAREVALSVAGDAVVVDTVVAPESPVEIFTEYAKDAHLIVLGTRGQGTLARALFGSVSDVVATRVRCPVAVVPEKFESAHPESDALPVVVGLDHSQNDDAVLAIAFDQAARRGVSLVAVHAFEPSDAASTFSEFVQQGPHLDGARAAQHWIDRLVALWAEKYPSVQVTTSVVDDRPSHALLAEAAHAQLIVVGARSRGSIEPLFMGSTSRAILHRTQVPTIIVPALRIRAT